MSPTISSIAAGVRIRAVRARRERLRRLDDVRDASRAAAILAVERRAVPGEPRQRRFHRLVGLVVEAPLQVERRRLVPVALPQRVGEAAAHRTAGVDADEVETLAGAEHGVDDFLGRRQRAAARRARGPHLGRDQEVRVGVELGQRGAQCRHRGGDRRRILFQAAGQRQQMHGVPRPAHPVDLEVALRDEAGLAHLAAVQAHEVGLLGREPRGVDVAVGDEAVEHGGEVVEVGLHRGGVGDVVAGCVHVQLSPPNTATSPNTHAGDAWPTRITCVGSPLPQYGRAQDADGVGVADRLQAAPEVGARCRGSSGS